MDRRIVLPLLAAAMVCPLLAGGFWQKKGWETWSREEAVRLLTRSPWAATVVVAAGDARTENRTPQNGRCPCGCGDTAVFEDVFGQGGEINTDAARNPKRVVAADEVMARSGMTRTFVVRFLTALPVRQAMARMGMLGGHLTPDRASRFIRESANPEKIVVAVGRLDGIPYELDRPIDELKGAVYLLLEGSRRRVEFEQFLGPLQTEQGEAFFVFPRIEDGLPAITQLEKRLRVVLELPDMPKFEAKFKLKDMIVGGELEI